MNEQTRRRLDRFARASKRRRRDYLTRCERLQRRVDVERAVERAKWRFCSQLGLWALSRRRGRKIRRSRE